MYYDICVIGGGASGMLAALSASEHGAQVAIIESTDRVGKKILTTGNGRCNITNLNLDINNFHSSNLGFTNQLISEHKTDFVRDLFETLGLPTIQADKSSTKLFPMSLQASSVVDILRLALDDRGISVYTDQKVTSISKSGDTFTINSSGEIPKFTSKKVVLSTGGKTFPKTGSDGSGYKLAKELGHDLLPTYPSIVQLDLDFPRLKSLSGTKFTGFASLICNSKLLKKDYGEILFTDYGISGPPILQLSRLVEPNKNKNLTLSLDLMPMYSVEELKYFLDNRFGVFYYRSISDNFIGLLNKKLIPIFLKECGIDSIHKTCGDLTWQERLNIEKNLKTWEFKVSSCHSATTAQVTCGGIDTRDVDPLTLESKVCKGLYVSGEVLDVDGDCGGYNLHWAWVSGYTAGKNSAISLK